MGCNLPGHPAPSHLQGSSTVLGSAAAAAEAKATKYAPLAMAHEFVPVAIETMGTRGPWGARELAFINELGRRIAEQTGDPR